MFVTRVNNSGVRLSQGFTLKTVTPVVATGMNASLGQQAAVAMTTLTTFSPVAPIRVSFLNSLEIQGTSGSVVVTHTRNSVLSLIDSSGVKTDYAANVPAFDSVTAKGILVEPLATNLFLNSAVGVTQTITTTAIAYVLSFYGTGNIVRSGTNTGTLTGTGVNNRVTVSFTPTAGTLTLTVNGSCTNVQFEAMPSVTSPIITAGATVTRQATNISLGTVNGNLPTTGGWTTKCAWTYLGGAKNHLPHCIGISTWLDASNFIGTFTNGSIVWIEKRVAGVSTYVTKTLVPIVGTTYKVTTRMNADYTMQLFVDSVAASAGFGSELVTQPINLLSGWSALSAPTLTSDTITNTGATSQVYFNGTFERVYKINANATATAGVIQLQDITQGGSIGALATDLIYRRSTAAGGMIPGFYNNGGIGAVVTVLGMSIKEVYNNTDTTSPAYGTTLEVGCLKTGTLSRVANANFKNVEIYPYPLGDSQC